MALETWVATEVGTNSHSLLVFWLFLQISAGHILLPILVFIFTFFTKRHPTLINLCLTWMFTGIFSCLLLYAGHQTGPEPPFDLCLTQSSLLYGVPPMTSVACFTLVFQVWNASFNTRVVDHSVNRRWRAFRPLLLVAAPWIVFTSWASAAAFIGYHRPETISRSRRFFYCSIDYKTYTNGVSVFSSLFLLATMVLEVLIGLSIFRNWRAVRQGNINGVDLPLVFRIIAFGVYVFIGLILSILSINAPRSPVPDLWIASVGLVVVLIFGTQKSIWTSVWSAIKDSKWKRGQESTLVDPEQNLVATPHDKVVG